MPSFFRGPWRGDARTRRSELFPFLPEWSPMSVQEISHRTRNTSTPQRCLRLRLTQRDDPRTQSTLFALASSAWKLKQRAGDLLLTRLLHHLDKHFSGCVGFVTSRKKADAGSMHSILGFQASIGTTVTLRSCYWKQHYERVNPQSCTQRNIGERQKPCNKGEHAA